MKTEVAVLASLAAFISGGVYLLARASAGHAVAWRKSLKVLCLTTGIFAALFAILYFGRLAIGDRAGLMPGALAIGASVAWGVILVRSRTRGGREILALDPERTGYAVGMVVCCALLVLGGISLRRDMNRDPFEWNRILGDIVFISIGIWSGMSSCTRSRVREQGVLYRGSFWRWNKFSAFSWGDGKFRPGSDSLRMILKGPFGGKDEFSLFVPEERKDAFNQFLTQHVQQGGA